MRSFVATIVLLLPTSLFAATTVASYNDAFVLHDEAAEVWTIGSEAIAVSYRLGPGRQLQLAEILNRRTGHHWSVEADGDGLVTLAGTPAAFSAAGTGLVFSGATAAVEGGGVRVVFTYTRSDLGVELRRIYACYPRSPVVETWMRLDAAGAGSPIPVSAVTTWRASVARGTVRWLNGLQGDSADAANEDAFAPQARNLAATERLTIGSAHRSSERSVPILMIDGPAEEFIVGSIWSGPWQMSKESRYAGGKNRPSDDTGNAVVFCISW